MKSIQCHFYSSQEEYNASFYSNLVLLSIENQTLRKSIITFESPDMYLRFHHNLYFET